MSRNVRVFLIVAVAVGLGVFLCRSMFADEPPSAEKSVNVQKLLERLEKLELRVTQLEAQLRLPRHYVLPSRPAIPVPSLPQPVPKGWQRGQINGIPYYVIPLEKKSR